VVAALQRFGEGVEFVECLGLNITEARNYENTKVTVVFLSYFRFFRVSVICFFTELAGSPCAGVAG
jgi:hypothetical protein